MLRGVGLGLVLVLFGSSCGSDSSAGAHVVDFPSVSGASAGFGHLALLVAPGLFASDVDLLIVDVIDGVPHFDEAVRVDIARVNTGTAVWTGPDELLFASQEVFAGEITMRRISADGVVRSSVVADPGFHLDGFMATDGAMGVVSLSRNSRSATASNVYRIDADTGAVEFLFGTDDRAQVNPVAVPGGWLYADSGLPSPDRIGPDLRLQWVSRTGEPGSSLLSPGDTSRMTINDGATVVAAAGFGPGDRQSPAVWVADIVEVTDQAFEITEWRRVFDGRTRAVVFVGHNLWVFDDGDSTGGSTPVLVEY